MRFSKFSIFNFQFSRRRRVRPLADIEWLNISMTKRNTMHLVEN